VDVVIEELPNILQGFWLNIRLFLWSALFATVLGTILASFRVSPVPVLRGIGKIGRAHV
jgi:ABC-type amino acid transport system permease subunit